TGTDDLGNSVSPITITTDPGGNYTFGNLRPGTYTLTETQPANWLQGADLAGSAGGTLGAADTVTGITLNQGSTATGYIYAELVPTTLSGNIFLDSNQNGVDDPGEAGLAGVAITLQDSRQNTVATTTSASDGSYSFTNLPVGNYTLVET